MAMNGWVKLWRKSLESGLLQDPELWTFWCWCLMKAVHRPQRTIINKQVVELQPGQFIFGRKKAASDLPLSEQTIRTCLKKLEKLENLTIQSTSRYSIITIVNWESYQQSDQPSNHPIDQPLTSHQPAANQPLTTSGECEEGEECEEGYSSSDEEERSTSSDEEPAATAPATSSNGVPAQKILSLWNEEVQSSESPMPRVQRIKQGTQRYKHVRARWRENPDLELWKTVIAKAARSSFLNGRIKAWQADFDWIIKSPDNFTKVLEGKYDDREEPAYADAGPAPF